MKKRLLSALLALALVFVLLPTTALADTTPVTDENVKINGTPVTVGNGISLGEGNGTYSYDKSTRTLTLNNATITATGSNIGIDFCDTTNYVTYSVILTGENTVTSNNIAIETTPNTNLTFTGGGNLKAITNGYYQAIRVYGTLTIDNSTLIAESSAYTATTVIWTLAMTGNNAKLEISNKSAANIVAGTAGPASNIDWSNYQFTTGSYSGDALTESDPEVCSWGTLKEYLGFPTKKYSQYICIAKRTIPAIQRTSDVFIAGKDAVVGQWTTITADSCSGSYYYNAANKELTLKGITITRNNNNNVNHAIQFTKNGDYTINLEGTNNISSVANGICALNKAFYDDPANISVTISGSGSLNVIANTYAIDMQVGNLIFNNTGNITLATNTNYQVQSTVCNALRVKSGSITIDNTKYDIVGARQEKGYPTETISDSSAFTPDLLNGYTVDETTTLFKTITITPAAAKDSTIRYNGTTLKQGETITGENGGTATVDSKNNTITLDNFKGNYPLEFNAEFTPNSIILIGDSTLSAVETKYQNLTISGSGSLTVGSIKVHNQKASSDDKPNLTINGATVTVGTAELTTRAIDIDGDLTITNGSLTATSASNNVPTVQVGGNASFTGSTVTITNNSTTQGEQYKDSNAASSALHVNGAVTISGGTVTAEAKAGGNAIRAVGNITVSNDATVTAKNNSQYFNAITAGQASGGVVNNLSKLIVSGETTKITATNSYANSSTGAIHAKIKNANEGHYLQVGTGTDTKAIAPNAEDNNTGRGSITITRGDAYETPQVTANYKIAGQTMHVGKYYKTDAKNGNITDGTAQDYNIFCDSANDFTLNNATISSTGTSGSTGVIMTNLNYSSAPFHIKLIGTNSINNAGHHAILGEGAYSTIIIENAENASNASLTISGNYLPVYSFGNVTINAEVVIINTNGNLISTNKGGHANGAFDLGSGYKCYASTDVSGSPLETYDAAKSSTYKYLCVTTKTLETGGGSTHQHVWDEAWHDTGDYHHAHQCTICKAYDTTTQEPHNVTGHRDNHDGSHSNICGSCGYSAKVSHSYTWAPNANDNEKHIGTCVCGNVVERYHNFVGDVCSDCGYDKSTGTTCEHVWTTEWTIDTVDNEYHWHKCIKCNAITDKKPHAYTIVTDSGTNHIRECECKVFYVEDHISSDWIIDTPATATTAGSMHKECTVCKHKMQTEVIPATGEIEPPTPDNPGTIVIIRPAEEEKPAQQPNPSTGANDLVGLAVAAAVAAALGSAALLRKHD